MTDPADITGETVLVTDIMGGADAMVRCDQDERYERLDSPQETFQYVGAIQLLGEITADIETTHLFQRGLRPTNDRGAVVREVVRQPGVFQRFVYERVQWVTQKLR